MTELQYWRWKGFALRMAHRGLGLRSRKSRRFVAAWVKNFFRMLDSDYFHVNEPVEPAWCEVLGRHIKWGQELEFLRGRIIDWCNTGSHPTYRDSNGHESNGPYICDIVSEMDERWNPHYWGSDADFQRWDDKWGSRIRCCLRAGMDMAVAPSAGVIGFTAGDLRRMYRGRVPNWVSGGDERWVVGFGREERLNGTFAQIADDVPVWL